MLMQWTISSRIEFQLLDLNRWIVYLKIVEMTEDTYLSSICSFKWFWFMEYVLYEHLLFDGLHMTVIIKNN